MTAKPIIIGLLGKPFGVHGWMYIDSFSSPPDDLFSFDLFLKDGTSLSISDHRKHKKRYVVKIENIDSPEDAKKLINQHCFIARSDLPPINDDQFYWCDLIGLTIEEENLGTLGTLSHLYQQPDLVVAVIKSNGIEKHIPLLPSVLKEIDFEKGIVHVQWPY